MKKRIEGLNQLIKVEVGRLILRDIEFPKDVLVTVTRVEVTADTREGRVYISAFPEKNEDWVLNLLNKNIFSIQKKIDKRLRMRVVPKISFRREKGTTEAEKIEKILEKIKSGHVAK